MGPGLKLGVKKLGWEGPERVEVKNSSDDLWIGVKGQSNLVIAGSLRNIFRYSVMLEV